VSNRLCAVAAVAVSVGLSGPGLAAAQESGWRPFITVSPVYQGDADLDNGGDFSVGGILLRGGVSRQVNPDLRAGVTLSYDYLDYSFSNPTRFGGVAPWNIVQHYGAAIPLSFALRDGWSVGFAPSVDWFRENGADTGESFSWGAIVSATKRFDSGNRVGLGVGVYDRIEKTSAFPFLIVDVRLTDRWRLINPLAAGPTGPAGLELDYRFDSGWTMGLGGAYRSLRFRLSEGGPVPNGVGEERGLLLFLRGTREFGREMALNLYAGVVTAGRLRVEDASGNLLEQDDFDPAPLFGAAFTARF
jgi:hypothetical protein